MKLLSKTNRYFLVLSMIVFALGGILFYLLFQVIMDRDLERKLLERKNYIIKQISESDSLIFFHRFSANTLAIRRVVVPMPHDVLSDTIIFDDIEKRPAAYRQLQFTAANRGRIYNVQIRRALVEQADLIKGVVLLESGLFLAFVAALTAMNNVLSKRMWKPFYQILETVNNFKIDRVENITFDRSSTSEFNELAGSIEKMSAKISHEFIIQKQFLENASHETQTPLAIIKNEMEFLLQDPGLSETQMQSLSAASLAANRLSKVNETLLILSRIENRQFHQVEDVCINDLMDRQLDNFDELMQMKKISFQKEFIDRVSTKMNPFLADMLLENLITNAIKHNVSPGTISFTLRDEVFQVANSGEAPRENTQKLFDRFAKSNPKSSSLGLGLSIVKAICETYVFPITYVYENGLHKISVVFNRGSNQ